MVSDSVPRAQTGARVPHTHTSTVSICQWHSSSSTRPHSWPSTIGGCPATPRTRDVLDTFQCTCFALTVSGMAIETVASVRPIV
eukprot:6376974-Prymnesium_polylepis.1